MNDSGTMNPPSEKVSQSRRMAGVTASPPGQGVGVTHALRSILTSPCGRIPAARRAGAVRRRRKVRRESMGQYSSSSILLAFTSEFAYSPA